MEELKNLMTEIGEKPFRAKQIYAWLHQQLVTSWDEMTNLSKSLREKLSVYPITALSQADVRISKIDGTRKYLFQLEDGNVIVSVALNIAYGYSIPEVSQKVQEKVKNAIETMTGLTVAGVNVRIAEVDMKTEK